MPSYRRLRYRRYRPRRYVRRWFRRRFRRYVNGSSKSTVRMKTAVESSVTISVPNNALSAVYNIPAFGSPSASINARSVLASPLYRTYCSLYEEVKCVGMKVSLSVASPIGGTALPSLQIYTAWDRRHGYSEAPYTADGIKNSSTYNVATALNNNVAKLTRSIYASDLMEKAQWHDCKISGDPQTNSQQDDAFVAAAGNPNFFAPSFFMTLASPSLAAAQSPATVALQFSVVYYMAFRNPKYGAGASASKLDDLGARVSIDDDDGDASGGGDMDDTPATAGTYEGAPSRSVMSTASSAADHVVDRQRQATRAIQRMQREADLAARRSLNP